MSHYAKVLGNRVLHVIRAEPSYFEPPFVDTSPGEYIQTSFNTKGNVHYDDQGNPDGGIALRGNFASAGDVYDRENDVFYTQQPYPSWILDKATWTWKPPVECPITGHPHYWDEASLSWKEITFPQA